MNIRKYFGLTTTFGKLSEEWIEFHAKKNNSSWRLQLRQLERHIYPTLYNKNIRRIAKSDIFKILNAVEGSALPNRLHALLKTIFRYAVIRDAIKTSPLECMRKPMRDPVRTRVLTTSELGAIWRASEVLGYPFGSFLKLLMITGQRRTEVASMRWRDIDPMIETWVIDSAFSKNGRPNLIPLPVLAREIIGVAPRDCPYVFTTNKTAHISCYSKMKMRIEFELEKTGVLIPDWRFHDFRRSAATHMIRIGGAEAVVRRILNHAPVGVGERVYLLHSYAREKRHLLHAWSEELLKISSI